MSTAQVLPDIKQSAQQHVERSQVFGRNVPIAHRDDHVFTTTTLQSLVPGQLMVGHLLDSRLRVFAPFLVQFAAVDGHVVAEASDFNEFGYGANTSEALRDLQHALAELYFELEAMQDKLGPDLLAVWNEMRSRIRACSTA